MTLIIESYSDGDRDDLDEIVHGSEGDAWEDFVDQATTLGRVLSMHPPSIDDGDMITRRHLSVVRCALAQPKENNK